MLATQSLIGASTPLSNLDRPGDGQYTLDSYTKVLIHSDHADGSTTMTDSSASGHTVTSDNGAHHDTAKYKIGGSSFNLEGDNNIQIAHSTDLDFDGEFTIDFWAYYDNLPANLNGRFFQKGDNSGTGYGGFISSSHLIYFGRTDENLVGYTQNLTDSAWHHIAISRDGDDDIRLFIDGILRGTNEIPTNMNNSGVLFLGQYPGGTNDERYDGWMDEFRISKGIARWTANFTVY